jgi:hypothetical protein
MRNSAKREILKKKSNRNLRNENVKKSNKNLNGKHQQANRPAKKQKKKEYHGLKTMLRNYYPQRAI